MTTVQIELPDEALHLPGQTEETLQTLAREALLVRLYTQKIVTSEWAAQALGISRGEFLMVLTHYGVTEFDEQEKRYQPVKAEGIWEGVTISDEDIADVRREMQDSYTQHTNVWWVLALVLVCCQMMLAACGAASNEPPAPTASPAPEATSVAASTPTTPATPATPASTTTTTSTTTPTTATTPTSSTLSGALPAPLYLLTTDGAIERLEPDGTTRTRVTPHEAGRVTGFDVSPTTGLLAYIVHVPNEERQKLYYSRAPDTTTGVADMTHTELFSGSLRSPVFLADDEMLRELDPTSSGQQVAYSIYEPLQHVEPERAGPGIFVSLDLGMCPFLLLPDEPDSHAYEPLALSPDGSRLLLRDYVPDNVGAALAVLDIAEGTVTPLQRTDGTRLACCDASWGGDPEQAVVYVADAYGLWQADATDGTSTLLLSPVEAENGAVALPAYPQQFPDGTVGVFLSDATMPAPRYTMHQIDPAGGTAAAPVALRDDGHTVINALWAPDGSGVAVAVVDGPNDEPRLLWLPADGGDAVAFPVTGHTLADTMRWAVEPEE